MGETSGSTPIMMQHDVSCIIITLICVSLSVDGVHGRQWL